MVLQHNIPALNALRNNLINNSATAKNLEKLSSGYRINRAADDAAGLAISEKMRGQINGLNMATQNTENAVNLIQTGEGGLNEIHAILHRMRELAVQASNGTYQDEDREQINLELQSIKSEIDRISTATHFNGINLLDGSLGGVKATNFADDADLQDYLVSLGFISGGGAEIECFDTSFYGEYCNLIITSALEFGGSVGDTARVALQVGDKIYMAVHDVPNGYVDVNGNTLTDSDGRYLFLDQDGFVVAWLEPRDSMNGIWILDSDESGVITNIRLDANGSTTKIAKQGTSNTINSDHAMYAAMIGLQSDKLIFQIGANGGADQQVGLRVENMSSAHLGTLKATQYNSSGTITEIDVRTREEANDAIDVIDAAVKMVSATRATLGALQNRLEHTLNNLGVTRENLQAAESTIRDVDMAKEMMEFTKNNIMVQSSQAMLAQANALPQGVLSLFQ